AAHLSHARRCVAWPQLVSDPTAPSRGLARVNPDADQSPRGGPSGSRSPRAPKLLLRGGLPAPDASIPPPDRVMGCKSPCDGKLTAGEAGQGKPDPERPPSAGGA